MKLPVPIVLLSLFAIALGSASYYFWKRANSADATKQAYLGKFLEVDLRAAELWDELRAAERERVEMQSKHMVEISAAELRVEEFKSQISTLKDTAKSTQQELNMIVMHFPKMATAENVNHAIEEWKKLKPLYKPEGREEDLDRFEGILFDLMPKAVF